MNNRFSIGFLLMLWISMVNAAPAVTAGEQTAAPQEQASERANKGVVGIVTGGVNGTYIRIAADMAAVLDADDLRVLAIIGKGSAQNINDLLYLKGVDIAIVQSDVLEYLRRQGTYKNIDKRIQYITKLYNEEFHLLANPEIKNPSDLAGRKVNFDVKGSGTSITASILFDTLKIPVEPTYHDQAAALEKLKSGEIAALAYIAGKPAPLFEKLTTSIDHLHFVPIEHTPALMETYLPTRMSNQDYPNLITSDQEVKTIAIGAVLAVYNWGSNNIRYKKTANFVNRFFEHFSEFQQPARHPKWREVSLSAVIPGWTRFPAAQEWLRRQ